MVKCIDCNWCIPAKSEVDRRRFLGCLLKQLDLNKKIWESEEDPEKWSLMEKNPEVLEKMWKVQPLDDHDCPKFEKRTEEADKAFDIKKWWFEHGISKDQRKS
jgi:hypothetical protein